MGQWVDVTELRIAMAKQGISTWKELVSRSGVSRKSLYNIVNHKSVPTHEATYRLKRVLKLSDSTYFKVFPEQITYDKN
jgi:transcriptional regulator with XRE-family HTH domain